MKRQIKALEMVRDWMQTQPNSSIPSDLFCEVSNSIDETKIDNKQDCALQAKQPLSHFDKLILQATENKNREQRGIESDLKIASSIILEKAAASLPPDKYTRLEQDLVDLFMIYVK